MQGEGATGLIAHTCVEPSLRIAAELGTTWRSPRTSRRFELMRVLEDCSAIRELLPIYRVSGNSRRRYRRRSTRFDSRIAVSDRTTSKGLTQFPGRCLCGCP